ncbi:hypothetical protein J6590_034872 [Homalodisca vitripennis]|nr:hypothetical protein J6590_034872 [Homalodisca vitripennis]
MYPKAAGSLVQVLSLQRMQVPSTSHEYENLNHTSTDKKPERERGGEGWRGVEEGRERDRERERERERGKRETRERV